MTKFQIWSADLITASLLVLSITSVVYGVEQIPWFIPSPATSNGSSSSKESVRDELIQLQAQDNLTLARFDRGISFVDFTKRWETPTKESFAAGNGVEGEGAITRDGNDIAFILYRGTRASSLGVIRRDGGVLQQFPNITAPFGICWSYDKSHLAMSTQVPATQYQPLQTNLVLLDISMKEIQQMDVGGYVTSQCWSPEGRRIVYEADDSIRVYDIDRKESRVLAKGKYPTWSSDGQWLAFLDNDTYYAITPFGERRKILFKKQKAFSGLWWSPDSRIVAYLSQNGPLEGPISVDIEQVRLRVRRLADGSEDWVAQDSAAYLPSYQWVANKHFVKTFQSSTQSK